MDYLLKIKIKYIAIIILTLLALNCFWWMFFVEKSLNKYWLNKEDEESGSEIDGMEYTRHDMNSTIISTHDDDEFEDQRLFFQQHSNTLTELDDGSFHDFEVDRVMSPVKNALEHAESNKLPFIVWWTSFTNEQGKLKRCWHGDCFFSINRTYDSHPQTKAFLFYGTDVDIKDLPLPRKAYHDWGLFHEESPKNQPLFYYKDVMELFNHTCTFKQQSSYPISTQYILSASYLLASLTYTRTEKESIQKEQGLASVIYVQSGCNPPSDRDSYIQELMKWIKIDSYGKCLHNKDFPKDFQDPLMMNSKPFLKWISKYKFMISFENAICDDYMTEKLYRTLHIGAIPIYKGAPNIREWLPNNYSAIIVDDFKDPKQLADYINKVNESPELYEKYMLYKKEGMTNIKLNKTLNDRQWGVDSMHQMNFVTGFECHVCDRIHKGLKLQKEGKAPIKYQATLDHYGCPEPVNYDLPDVVGIEDWERRTWSYEYTEAKEKARTLKEKILNSVE